MKWLTSSDRGTTLVELLVVLALISIMVLVAADLVVHSIKLVGATGRSVRNPLVVHVTGRLRNDIQTAAGVRNPENSWADTPLAIRTRNSRILQFEVVEGNLFRRNMTLEGNVEDERLLLRGVTAWWWQAPAPGVVDLRIGYLIYPGTEKQSSRDVGYGKERRTENLRFAIRGHGSTRRW